MGSFHGLTGGTNLHRYKPGFNVTIVYPVRTAASHVAKRGSNPLGDAKFRYNEECQGPKNLGILRFFFPVWFPEVQPRPLASKHFMGISVGRNVIRHF